MKCKYQSHPEIPQDPRTSGPLMRQPSGHGTHLSLRPFLTSSRTWSMSLASLSRRCLIVQGGAGRTLSPLSCLMQETESSAWVTTTAPSTPRSTAHTEQGPSFSDFPPGPPVPARPPSFHPATLSTQNLSQNVQKYSLTECFYKSFQCSAHIFLCFLANVKRGLLAHAQP